MIPLSCIFAGLSVLVDRHTGAQRELLAAPVPRAYLVLGNLIVAIGLATLQVARADRTVGDQRRGVPHHRLRASRWFVGAALLFTVFMYGVAETLASRVTKQEDYVGATPAVAILPFFLAGALFPIGAMPGVLTAIAKVFPLTHALALHALRVHRPERQGPA